MGSFPEEGDLVLCTVTNVQPNCAFARLDEYENLEGMIHISEVASSWVKSIRNHVKEGKQVVCKVTGVDREKRYVNLSLKRVSEYDRSEKFEQVRRKVRSAKMLEVAAAKISLSAAAQEALRRKLEKGFTEAYFALEAAAAKGPEVLTKAGVEKTVAEALAEVASKGIVFSKVTVKGTLLLSSDEQNGVELIKKAISKAKGAEFHYISAPKYTVSVTAEDYKKADKKLREVSDTVIKELTDLGGLGEMVKK